MTEIIDNRKQRIENLKSIIRQLHEGAAPDAVRAQLKNLVRQCDAGEIAAMEHQLMTEDQIPVAQVMKMCDLHAEVVKDILVEHEHEEIKTGHPVDIFKRENIALQAALAEFDSTLTDLTTGTTEITPENTDKLCDIYNQLMDVDKHYARKENILFAILERHGISGPAKVMWGIDDEIRNHLKTLGKAITHAENQTPSGFLEIKNTVADVAFKALRGMIDKEERILLPMSLQTLTVAEWAEVHEQSPQFGWCLIDPTIGAEYTPPKPIKREISERAKVELQIAGIALEDIRAATDKRLEAKRQAEQVIANQSGSDQRILFPTGSLTFPQLKLLFAHLPVDLTFVDADDRVAFYSESTAPVFARNQAIIGRKVQNCHPPSSVHQVERILNDFKSGRQEVADFWINFGERFIFIRYFAVRNEDGEYAGCLEVTQDITRPRSLEGERRILEYDS